MKHIKFLLLAEQGMNIYWDRSGENTLVLSSVGYRHQDLSVVEKKLLALGCRYDFSKCPQEFDPISGRTYTYMIEPKKVTV